MKISLGYNSDVYSFDILKVDDLPFLVLLGRDTPAFKALIQAALPQTAALVSEEEEPGPSTSPANPRPLDSYLWEDNADFRRAQDTNPSLSWVRDDLAIEEDHILDA